MARLGGLVEAKPFFEADDFVPKGVPWLEREIVFPSAEKIAAYCNEKLASHGIEAGSIGPLKEINRQLQECAIKLQSRLDEAPIYYAYRNSLNEWAVCAERFGFCTHSVRLIDFKRLPEGT